MKKLALFASGSGSNVENIAHYFSSNDQVQIQCVLTNNLQAGVIERCKRLNLPLIYINPVALATPGFLSKMLVSYSIDLIVLAGYLKKIPSDLIEAFPHKIINIHPALLPNYGGKGMYGNKVHEAVKASGDNESGITIHYVNEHYDQGAIIEQQRVPVDATDTPESIAEKVHALEYQYFPKVIDRLLDV